MSSEERKEIGGAQPQPDESLAANPDGSSRPESEPGRRRDPSSSRRKLLIRGLVGGPVALAAMRPVKTFAAKKYCQYSGWASFKAHPHTSAAPKQKCTVGKKIGHYKTGGWPSSIKNYAGYTTTLYQGGTHPTQFKKLFGGSDATTCATYLNGTSNQASFICAAFNAQQVSGYPFTVPQIYAIWTNPSLLGHGVTQSGAALFFEQLNVNS